MRPIFVRQQSARQAAEGTADRRPFSVCGSLQARSYDQHNNVLASFRLRKKIYQCQKAEVACTPGNPTAGGHIPPQREGISHRSRRTDSTEAETREMPRFAAKKPIQSLLHMCHSWSMAQNDPSCSELGGWDASKKTPTTTTTNNNSCVYLWRSKGVIPGSVHRLQPPHRRRIRPGARRSLRKGKQNNAIRQGWREKIKIAPSRRRTQTTK